MVSQLRTVLEIVTLEWQRQGGKGDPPRAWIKQWRTEHADEYGKWGLWAKYYPGSTCVVLGGDACPLNVAAKIWRERHGGSKCEHDAEYEALVRELQDFDEETTPDAIREKREQERKRDKLAAINGEARKYQERVNAEEIAKGNLPPFKEWWLEEIE